MNNSEPNAYNLNVERIINLYNKYGNCDYIGEKITLLEHTLQTAIYAESFLNAGYKSKKLESIIEDILEYEFPIFEDRVKNSIIIGALLHDIGHLLYLDDENVILLRRLGIRSRDEAGAMYLQKSGFNDIVVYVVKNHIRAKRYLITKYPNYKELLSKASILAIQQEGGELSQNEIKQFENDPYFKYAILVGITDEYAKVQNHSSQGIENYRKKMLKCISSTTYS